MPSARNPGRFAGLLYILTSIPGVFAMIGAAVSVSKNFPRWLGLWGIVGGTLCFITGLGAGLRFSSAAADMDCWSDRCCHVGPCSGPDDVAREFANQLSTPWAFLLSFSNF